jgi:hypothetical protein
MPIRQYLNGHRFDEETVRVLGVAFVITRMALKLENKEGPAQRAIAAKLRSGAAGRARPRPARRAGAGDGRCHAARSTRPRRGPALACALN